MSRIRKQSLAVPRNTYNILDFSESWNTENTASGLIDNPTKIMVGARKVSVRPAPHQIYISLMQL